MCCIIIIIIIVTAERCHFRRGLTKNDIFQWLFMTNGYSNATIITWVFIRMFFPFSISNREYIHMHIYQAALSHSSKLGDMYGAVQAIRTQIRNSPLFPIHDNRQTEYRKWKTEMEYRLWWLVIILFHSFFLLLFNCSLPLFAHFLSNGFWNIYSKCLIALCYHWNAVRTLQAINNK